MNFIDLIYYSPHCASSDDQQAKQDAFVATEVLLGEEVLDKWIGAIEVAPIGRQSRLLSLDRLKPTVDSVIQSIRDQLPDRPYYQFYEEAEWCAANREPEAQEDYPGEEDLVAMLSINETLLNAMLQHTRFFSGRFSRCGETFCFVKIEGTDRPEGKEAAYRQAIEDKLNATLVPTGLGCSVGGGTGIRYSYIHLALTDLAKAIKAARQALQAAKVPVRSWILFFDGEWNREWVGIWDRTPAPPMADDATED